MRKLIALPVVAVVAATALISCSSAGDPSFRTVPDMKGQTIEDAMEQLQDLMLEWSFDCRDIPDEVVVGQYPEPGAVRTVGTTIELRCSSRMGCAKLAP
jgi:beta-lactam-binding protein with PASTA domain